MIKLRALIILILFPFFVSNQSLLKTESIKFNHPDDPILEDMPILSKPKLFKASWYDLHGRYTSSGERMHRDSLTAACNWFPLGTKILVTNLANKKSCIIKVNDRMEYTGSNHIDLSAGAFAAIHKKSAGLTKVHLQVITNPK